MLRLTGKTNKGKFDVQCPQSWEEVSVDQYQRIIGEWDGEDWIQLFSILSGIEADSISASKDGKMEGAIYETIAFVLAVYDWSALEMPKTLRLTPIWLKDAELISPEIEIPGNIGRLSIGQAIQARKSLEGVKDLREGIGKVTAIYLQPLLDKGPFDMLRVTHYEYIIDRMHITKIYPLGFFLLRKLNESGKKPTGGLNLILNWTRTTWKKTYLGWRRFIS